MARTQFSGSQVKDESLTTDDIQNGTVLLEDLAQEVLDALGGTGAIIQWIDGSASNTSYTLPDATTTTDQHIVKRIDDSSYKTTISTTSSQLIDGKVTHVEIYGLESVTFEVNNGGWYIV